MSEYEPSGSQPLLPRGDLHRSSNYDLFHELDYDLLCREVSVITPHCLILHQ